MKRKLISIVIIVFVLFSMTACISRSKERETFAATQALLTNEQALSAITNYLNDVHKLENYTGEAPCYWDIDKELSNDDTAVVCWRSYTAAHVYFYIDRVSGDTYVMESAPGSDKKEKTEETLNAREYLSRSAK